MNFWKKLFAGMGFVCGFLVFETMSLAYRNSSRRHKNRKGRCRRNSSWDTLTRYMIFAWIYDGVKKSREQVGRRYYRRTGSEFRPSCDSDTRSNPSEPAKAAPKTADAAQPKKQRSPPSAPKTAAKTASASTADRLKVPAAEAKPPRETTVKPAPAAEKFLPDAVPDTENLPVPEPKTPQEVEAEHQQMLARLRTELQEQVCAIHADVTLQPDREQGSEATEQQLHLFFALIGMIYGRTHTRDVRELTGLMKVMPFLSVCYVIAGLANLGLPGLSGFIAEMTIFVGSFQNNDVFHRTLTIIACSSIVITAVYILRLVGKILYGTCTNKHHLALTDATWDERVAVICLIVCVAGLGMAPFWVSHMIGESVLPVVSQLIP